MTGYHKVKAFHANWNGELKLPEGWKPFAAIDSVGGYKVIARLWCRAD